MLIELVLILLSFFAYTIRKRQLTIFERIGIPGPKPNFIFGNAIDIAKRGTSKVFPNWTKKYGKIVGFHIGGRPQVLVTDLDLIRLVFVKDFHVFTNRHQLIPGGFHPQFIFQNSIVWSKGSAWKKLRSTLTPSFSISKLNTMEAMVMTSIENMMKQIDEMTECGLEFNIKHYAEKFSLLNASNCLLGSNFSMPNEFESMKKAIRPQLEKSMLAMLILLFPSMTFIAYPLRILWETIRLKMMWSHEGIFFATMRKIVRLRKAAETKMNDLLQLLLDCDPSGDSFSNKTDSLGNSLATDRTKQRLSENEVISNAFVFVLAAFETTSTTLQFIISDLVNHQDVQDELRNELIKHVHLNGGIANLKSFTEVPLLSHVIKESLRMHPPVAPSTSRIGTENYEYKGIHIPKGTGIFIDVMSIHYDPELWSEPEKYKPGRFAKEFEKLAFLPFGTGPRNCMGMRFALMVLQLVLANLILRYRFEPGPSTEKNIQNIETLVTLMPKNGVYCKAIKVDNNI